MNLIIKIVLALLVITAVVNLPLLATIGAEPYLSAVIVLFWGLLVATVFGLAKQRPWGFIVFYILAVYATVCLSISFVPLLPKLFPEHFRPWVMIATNILLVLVVARVHRDARLTSGK